MVCNIVSIGCQCGPCSTHGRAGAARGMCSNSVTTVCMYVSVCFDLAPHVAGQGQFFEGGEVLVVKGDGLVDEPALQQRRARHVTVLCLPLRIPFLIRLRPCPCPRPCPCLALALPPPRLQWDERQCPRLLRLPGLPPCRPSLPGSASLGG
jgi:hypothetical protein